MEVLVVLSIIVVLAGLLLPALNRACESSRRIQCLSNLRQLYFALQYYSQGWTDQVPIGYRTVSEQYNSMVYTNSASGYWVEFGLLVQSGSLSNPLSLYCPSEGNPKFMYNTPDNPWSIAPTTNIQAGYAFRPLEQIPDNLGNIPPSMQPFALPRLTQLGHEAILADLTASQTRVITRHHDGCNVLYADGSGHYIPLGAFAQPVAQWPDPATPPLASFNSTQDTIWQDFDAN